ncbi:pathogenesis-related transcriptional factor and ERF protein [Burkholderia pseudomallei]|nr:pathogenesis-related transcriptional factor and ERF protein [Burkholderia pseudomallei]CAJ5441156.1 pathogenesis-related transcriptional factor and ERF protein [Burkholderia pseudomallei]CAJ5552147.1 pathogenesis-related transcriptional factor and ERF protein [Burkholderia pseudomallei]CAJ5574989.1 pathogenesis-related transcriptional factor and ERF protein [Burkholderia pseudomallei]CAJ6178177.1 pathogenesis-related transcriptional factor and ERF protein [Burkholderia pseudomallei]
MGAVAIKLTGKHAAEHGLVAWIDESDLERVSCRKWRAAKITSSTGQVYFYAEAKIDGKVVYLHRFILDAKRGELVDHRDRDPLNCRRNNIRRCTHSQNMMNRPVLPQNKLGVKGVHFDQRRGRYYVEIYANGSRIRLGSYGTLDAAKQAYAEGAKRYHGEFANHE